MIFVGIVTIQNYSEILIFIQHNIEIINGILTPFIIGFIIAYILNYPMKYLENRFKMKRGICVGIVYGILLAIVVFTWLYVIPVIKSSVVEIYQYIPEGIKQIENVINYISNEFSLNINSMRNNK